MHKRQGGLVAHRYTPEGVLACLKLAGQLKPSADLSDVLADAAAIICGHDDEVVEQLRQKAFELPGFEQCLLKDELSSQLTEDVTYGEKMPAMKTETYVVCLIDAGRYLSSFVLYLSLEADV